jgi:anti-anti-sigma factor
MAEEAVRTLLIAELQDEIDVTNCDATAAGLLAAVRAPGVVIADMTGTAYCDSSGMRMLLTVHDRAHASGSALQVAVRPGTGVARMMTLLGLNRVLSVYESVEAALPPGCAAETVDCVRRVRMPELCAGEPYLALTGVIAAGVTRPGWRAEMERESVSSAADPEFPYARYPPPSCHRT